MKLLLDTHIALWAALDDNRLSAQHRQALTNKENILYLSAVSIWEISIKQSLGKLIVPDDFEEIMLAAGCRALPITWEHARYVRLLHAHHHDPFDRLLIAQALCEHIRIITADKIFQRYEVARL